MEKKNKEVRYYNRVFTCKCKNCGKEFKSNSNTTKYCDDCVEQKICYECGCLTEEKYLKDDSHIHICKNCAKKYGYRAALCICKNCGKEFFSSSNRRNYCDDCLKYPTCAQCGKIITSYKITINDDKQYFCCKKCSNQHKSGECTKPGPCVVCGIWNNKRDGLGQGIDVCGCCSKHLKQVHEDLQKPGYCTNPDCNKWSEERDRLGRCKECHDKWYWW